MPRGVWVGWVWVLSAICSKRDSFPCHRFFFQLHKLSELGILLQKPHVRSTFCNEQKSSPNPRPVATAPLRGQRVGRRAQNANTCPPAG